jgi:cobalt-zinc-cadmium efflux system outer membrane protein
MPGDQTHHARVGYCVRASSSVVIRCIQRIGIVSAFLVALVMPASAAESPALTERKAIELALTRPAYRDIEQGRLSTAESGVTEASLLPNPALSMERDRMSTPSGRSTETSVQISQTFDFSGRRALRQEAAGSRVDAARFDQQDRRINTIQEVRRLYSEAFYRDRLRAALAGWVQRIESAATVIAQLAKSGEVSGYDRRRLERESQTAKARMAGTAADYARMREALAGLTGETAGPKPSLDGELLPQVTPSLESVQATLRKRPDLASRNAQAEAFDRERSAAERAWIPDVTLDIGQKRVNEPGRSDNGVIVGVSVPIPLFNRGQASEQRARAQANTLRAEHALVLAKSEAELRGIWRQTTELRQAAESFRRDSLASSRDLTRIAEAAYRAGEGGILELLDAYKAQLEAETTLLDLELRARLARIELDALSGVNIYE